MILDLLLTAELKKTMPKSIDTLFDYGVITVIFPALDDKDDALRMTGNSVVLEGITEDFIEWLKPFDGVAVGCGTPQLEKFTIMHIDENLE